jgi:hypothetical protein
MEVDLPGLIKFLLWGAWLFIAAFIGALAYLLIFSGRYSIPLKVKGVIRNYPIPKKFSEIYNFILFTELIFGSTLGMLSAGAISSMPDGFNAVNEIFKGGLNALIIGLGMKSIANKFTSGYEIASEHIFSDFEREKSSIDKSELDKLITEVKNKAKAKDEDKQPPDKHQTNHKDPE